jgi:hypothetical protein
MGVKDLCCFVPAFNRLLSTTNEQWTVRLYTYQAADTEFGSC